MRELLKRLDEINLPALSALIVILLGLMAGGANDAASAAFFSAALLGLLIVHTLMSSPQTLTSIMSANVVPLLAFGVFVGLALLSAARVDLFANLGLSHPKWALLLGADAAPYPISLNPFRTYEGVASLLGAGGAYLLGALSGKDRQAKDWAGRWITIFSIVYAAIGLDYFFRAQAGEHGRLDVGVSSANAAATLFGMLALFALAFITRAAAGRFDRPDQKPLPRAARGLAFIIKAPLAFTALVLCLACLLLTASRGGIAATLLGLCILASGLAWLSWKRRAKSGLSIFAPSLALFGMAALYFWRGGGFVMERLARTETDLEIRQAMARAHWRVFLERPLFGHGLNSFHDLNAAASDLANWQALASTGAVHNIYIQALEETGLIGLALFVAMIAPALARLATRLLQARSGAEWAAATLAAAVLALAHGFGDFSLQVPAVGAFFAFALGVFAAAPERRAYA